MTTSTDPYFQQLFADRIGGVGYGKGTEIYKFEKIKRAKRKALADYPDRALLDFGIGENDSMAPIAVRERMAARSIGLRIEATRTTGLRSSSRRRLGSCSAISACSWIRRRK